ncbi:MAG: hypothetical protein DRZ76_04305, partial [Candidatus Nealsonbacteria bacterium]
MKKKRLENIKKNEVLLGLSFLIIIALLVFVLGTTTVVSPVTRGNYSGTMLLNCTTTLNASTISYNVTFYYNASGGATGTVNNLTEPIWNDTANDNVFNISADISWLSDALSLYNITCYADNGTDQEFASAVANITIDNTPPAVSFSGITNTINNGNYTNTTLVLNVSVSDATIGIDSVYFNITNSTGQQEAGNFTKASNVTGGYYNISLNAAGFADGKYNITVWANDSALTNASGDVVTNLNNTERIQITIDKTAPSSITLAADTTSTTQTQIVLTITAVDATSGIDNCVADSSSGITITGRGTGTQTLTHTGLSCGTSYSYIVTCYDQVGNSKSSTQTSFSTNSCNSGGVVSSAGGGGTISAIEKRYILTDITPEKEAILSTFQEDMGVKEIRIIVKNEAQNVKVTVKKYDSKPEEITVEKTGKVHRYLKIETENLKDKLEKAIITIKVQKNWLLDNALDKANVAVFKFDETAGKWNELSTIYKEEDDIYYYYEVQLTSF